jgi:putative transposase
LSVSVSAGATVMLSPVCTPIRRTDPSASARSRVPLRRKRPAGTRGSGDIDKPSTATIRLTVMMYVRYPLSLRQVEDLLFERGIDICHETVRFWWNRFGPMFAPEIRKRRLQDRSYSNWRWHLDEVFVRINGETHYLWRAVDHEGEVLEVFAKKRPDRRAGGRWGLAKLKGHRPPPAIFVERGTSN